MRNKLYKINFFELCSKKMELMKQIHLFKKGFVIFLKWAMFLDFFETRLSNYKPLAIRIRFLLFWLIFFQLGSNLINQWNHKELTNSFQIDNPNTFTMIYMDLFSCLYVVFPSSLGSQNIELANSRPDPFFCRITHVTETVRIDIYRKS